MRVKTHVSNSVYVTLDPEVLEQMFRSGGQSDAKVPKQAWYSIFQPTEGIKVLSRITRAACLYLAAVPEACCEKINRSSVTMDTFPELKLRRNFREFRS
ncbi:hypothetical protein TNCV_4312851 [Trichonephila clavipes]|nr:hypothetical protein TNCV_4312851 [Trichonephila clavipes]